MNLPHRLQKLQNAWRQSSRRRKILAICIIITCIFGGGLTLYLVNLLFGPSDWDGIPPHLHLGLRITEEGVYRNGTVSFTVSCYVESYKNYPIPESDLYQIEKAFICTERQLLEFNSTLGEIKTISEITVIEGDFSLCANEEVSLKFQTTFDLHNLSNIYVGVLALGPDDVVHRWDRYASIIF